MKITLACLSLCMFVALAADADRAKLAGSWQGNGTTWVIEDKGNTLHLTRSEGSQIVAEFECNIAGRDCEGKDSGRKATVSMWFNGGALVQMETKGSEVVKRRFAIAGPGDQLELQTILITPTGPTETVQFKRQTTAASAR
jgi:hypothetical protein